MQKVDRPPSVPRLIGYHNQRASAKNVFFSSISREDGLPHNDLPDLAAVVASHS